MEESVALDDVDGDAEGGGEALAGEHFGFRAIEEDTAVFEKDDAFDFRDDVVEVVSDEEDANAGLGEIAKLLADFAEGGEIEAGGGFVE